MARRKSVSIIRDVGVDPKYGSEIVQKFINVVMWRGKKNVARQIVYEALELLGKKLGEDKALRTLQKALDNVKPTIEVKARRVGGSVYQIPTEVDPRRANALAMRWIISSAATRGDKNMGLRLGYELLEAADGKGNAVKKRSEVHKMAESNRAFSHFSW